MNEIEKRFDAAMDLVTWLDHRITQHVEHQLEQRLARERECWRCNVVDLIVVERERVNALVQKVYDDIVDLTKADYKKIFDQVQQILERSQKTIVEMGAGVDRMFDRIEAKLDPLCRPDDDGQPPPSKR